MKNKICFALLWTVPCLAISWSDYNPYTKAKQGLDWIARNSLGYMEISPVYHPNTFKYIEELKKQDPEIYKNISFYIGDGPCSRYQSVYFPLDWVEKLEQEHQQKKQNGLYTEVTGMVALHEAGHIKHNDLVFAAIGVYLSNECRKLLQNSSNRWQTAKVGIPVACVLIATWTLWREYAADDYAMSHCADKQAWQAYYEFLDRAASSGIAIGFKHSFKGFRLRRIAKQYEKKFGEELPQKYHEFDRITG